MGDFQKPTGTSVSGGVVVDKLILTFEDVAKELNCSVRLVEKLVAEERIPYAKVGRLVRFSRARIHEWLQKGGNR